MNKLFKQFDGQLFAWLPTVSLLKRFSECNLLSHSEELCEALKQVREVCRAARDDGAGWLWTEKDVKKDGKVYTLPSVDMGMFFDISNNHDFCRYMEDRGLGLIAKKVLWDTEASAWYPRFKNRKDAIATIYAVNTLFDESYLIKKP